MSLDSTMNSIKAIVSDDRLVASVTILKGADLARLDALVINAGLDEKGVQRSPGRDARVAQLIRKAQATPDEDVTMVVVQGTAPVHATAGRLEVIIPDPGTIADAKGTVDYHARSAFRVVTKGQLIAIIHPPVEGSDGVDVRGTTIAARMPAVFHLQPDESVRVDSAGRVFAEQAGLLIHEGNTLKISPELRVPSSVDFSTGNIDFPGDIVIDKGVRDCFHVNSGRDCTVRDLVEAATIEVDRDANLERGMAAREIGRLTVGRDLRATYLLNVTGVIGRDAHISSSMTQCDLLIGRSLHGPTATLAGGEVLISSESEIGTLGSESSAPTSVVLGHMPDLEAKLLQIVDALEHLKQRVNKGRDLARMLDAQRNRLTPTQKEQLTEVQFQLSTDEGLCRRLSSSFATTYATLLTHARASLTIHSMLHQGVTLWVGEFKCTPKKDFRGPLRVWMAESGEPMFTMLTSHTSQPLHEICRTTRDPRFKPLPAPEQVAMSWVAKAA